MSFPELKVDTAALTSEVLLLGPESYRKNKKGI